MSSKPDRATAYARAVKAGKLRTGAPVRLACERHLRDLKRKDLNWRVDRAEEAVQFFPDMLVFEDGRPFELEAFQKFIIGSIFGWYTKAGDRRFRTAYCELGKGNGKSMLAAGVGIYGLVADGEPAPEVYAAAVTHEQARIVFRDATRMVEESPELRDLITPQVGSLTIPAQYATFRPVSSEHRSLDGLRVHMGLIDELHEHPSALVVDKIRAGTKQRRNALIFEITNALAIDTQIPTPNGWTTMGSLDVGDFVFDDGGNPCAVTATSEVASGHDCYRVVFDDGSVIVADAKHLWETRQRRGNTGEGGSKVGIRSTEEIAGTVRYRSLNCSFSNHGVRLAGPLKLPDRVLPVEPYALGVWLGDGDTREANIIVSDQDVEILENLAVAGVSVGDRRSGRAPLNSYAYYRIGGVGKRGRLGVDSLNARLRHMGLLDNKHIPQDYLRASWRQRLDLLKGLMDTDGSISSRTGRCVFTQHTELLVRQVAELVNTLGMKCSVRQSIGHLNGKEFPRWDVFFYPPWDLQVFGLERKQRHNRPRHSRRRMSQGRHIVGVEHTSTTPVKCISVASTSRLYLAGKSMIPTHNSGYDRHSVCWQHHEFSLKVLEGVIENDSWFAYVCQLGEGDDYRNKGCWIKANPGLGTILPEKYLSEQVEEAKGMPSKENIVRRLNFCEWTEQSVRAIPMDDWDRGATPIDTAALRGRACFGGLDLARVNDLSSLELLFPPLGDEPWIVLSFFWCPRDDIGRRALRDHVPYDVWERQGYLFATPGAVTDYGFIEAKIVELAGLYQIKEIAFDRTFAGEIVQNLMAEGLKMVEFGQGFLSMATPTAELLRMVKGGELQHGGHPVLRWNASNLAVATDAAGNIKPDKEHSTERIDGISALCNALGQAIQRPAPGPKQSYRVEWAG